MQYMHSYIVGELDVSRSTYSYLVIGMQYDCKNYVFVLYVGL